LFFPPGLGVRAFPLNKLFSKEKLSYIPFFQNREKQCINHPFLYKVRLIEGAANSTQIFSDNITIESSKTHKNPNTCA